MRMSITGQDNHLNDHIEESNDIRTQKPDVCEADIKDHPYSNKTNRIERANDVEENENNNKELGEVGDVRHSLSNDDICELIKGWRDCKQWSSDNGLDELVGHNETLLSQNSVELSHRGDTKSTSMDDSEHEASGYHTELHYQTSLRNERYHFIFAEMLIENMEHMHSEEYSYSLNGGYNSQTNSRRCATNSSGSSSGSYRGGWNDSVTVLSKSRGTAEVIAIAFMEDLSTIVRQLTRCDGRTRAIPEELQLLFGKLERRSLLSFAADISRSYDLLPEISVSKYPVSDDPGPVTVGGRPILGPDLSLPCYIASRSPSTIKRSDTLSLQQNLCPGCHCLFPSDWMRRRLRLCLYYCLYFCSVCHGNHRSIVPSRILCHWDFSPLPVSRPAYDLLQRHDCTPLFDTEHFSLALLPSSVRHTLSSIARLRLQGLLLVHFLDTCRLASSLLPVLAELPCHWFREPCLLSLSDLRLIKSGAMHSRLLHIVHTFTDHVSLCPLCRARGFLCELCQDRLHVIYPFQIDSVTQCHQCHACFHSRCCQSSSGTVTCPRCYRRMLRRQMSSRDDHDSADTDGATPNTADRDTMLD